MVLGKRFLPTCILVHLPFPLSTSIMAARSSSKKGKPSFIPEKDEVIVANNLASSSTGSPSSSGLTNPFSRSPTHTIQVTSSPKKGPPPALFARSAASSIASLREGMTDFTIKAMVEPFQAPVMRSSAGWQGLVFNVDLSDSTGLLDPLIQE